jgi:DNA-binding IclR family transcriptional regulator
VFRCVAGAAFQDKVDQKMASGQAPRSLSRLMHIFELLAERSGGMTLTEIAGGVDAPKTSLLNLLPPLVKAGYLVQVDGRYALGSRMFGLAATIMRHPQFMLLARPYMVELAESLQETISLAVLDPINNVAVYVESIDSPFPLNYTVPVGRTRPLYASVAGKVLLAFQTDEYFSSYLVSTPLVPRTPRTITSKAVLGREIKKVRAEGIAATVEESSEGISGFAAPIFDRDSRIVAALAAGGPTRRILDKKERCVAEVGEVALRVSQLLGYT